MCVCEPEGRSIIGWRSLRRQLTDDDSSVFCLFISLLSGRMRQTIKSETSCTVRSFASLFCPFYYFPACHTTILLSSLLSRDETNGKQKSAKRRTDLDDIPSTRKKLKTENKTTVDFKTSFSFSSWTQNKPELRKLLCFFFLIPLASICADVQVFASRQRRRLDEILFFF